MTIQTCDAHEDNLKCRNGVSWLTVGGGAGYCEHHARNAPYSLQLELRHIYYGEPLLMDDFDDDVDPSEWGE